MEEIIKELQAPETYIVPEEYIQKNVDNDEVWERIEKGPSHDSVEFESLDDLVTAYSDQWFNAIQSIRGMIAILDTIVKGYNIKRNDDNPQLPEGISQLFSGSNLLLRSYKQLIKEKAIFLTLNKIRQDWGCIDAYDRAPQDEKEQWFASNDQKKISLVRLIELLSQIQPDT